MNRVKRLGSLCWISALAICFGQKVELVPVVSRNLSQTIALPGEFAAFQPPRLRRQITTNRQPAHRNQPAAHPLN